MKTPWEWWDYHTWSTAWGPLPNVTGFGKYELWTFTLLALGVAGLLASLRRSGLGRRDLLWLLLPPLGAALSLSVFDLVDGHAMAAHESQIHQLFLSGDFPGGLEPTQVPAAIRMAYLWWGDGRDSNGEFVALALLLGSLGPGFAGAALRLLTGRWAVAGVAAALLTFHPALTYWRGHAYSIGPTHTVFAAAMLAAVIAGRSRAFPAFLAWFALGGFAVVLKGDVGGAVLATAALPLAVGGRAALAAWGRWAPALALAAAFTLPQLAIHQQLMKDIEDFVMAGYLARLHLMIPAFFAPLPHPAMLVLLGFGAAAWRAEDAGLRAGARGLLPVALLGVFPVVGFLDFGPRHLLPTMTAAFGLAGIGAVRLAGLRPLPPRAGPGIAAALLAWISIGQVQSIAELSPRYGDYSAQMPTLPNTEQPTTTELPDDWLQCALFADHINVCNNHPNCLPTKDLRDPGGVGRRWDEHGCVLWAVSSFDYWVTGARHERWLAISRHYPSEPVAVIPRDPDDFSDLHVYRMKRRPRVRVEARGANRRPGE